MQVTALAPGVAKFAIDPALGCTDAPLFFGNDSLLGTFVGDELERAGNRIERVSEAFTGTDTTQHLPHGSRRYQSRP